jgi:hypothetical protein
MGAFSTKLSLGKTAFVVSGGLDPVVLEMTVGQIRVIQTMPGKTIWADQPCYVEEYMCVETGVGSGQIYTYGKSIFATSKEAEVVVAIAKQRQHKERKLRDEHLAKVAADRRALELAELNRLQAKYANI